MFDGVASTVQLLFVPPTDLLRWADRVRPHIAKMAAASAGCYEPTDILAAMAAGRMILWVVLDGPNVACVLVTEVVQYPRRRAMRLVGVSGHRHRRWMHLLADVEQAAREKFGCDLMQALHQPSHGRMLCTGGWAQFHILSQKALA